MATYRLNIVVSNWLHQLIGVFDLPWYDFTIPFESVGVTKDTWWDKNPKNLIWFLNRWHCRIDYVQYQILGMVLYIAWIVCNLSRFTYRSLRRTLQEGIEHKVHMWTSIRTMLLMTPPSLRCAAHIPLLIKLRPTNANKVASHLQSHIHTVREFHSCQILSPSIRTDVLDEDT